MEYNRLGETDLNVSRIVFGCEAIGGTDWGQVDENESRRAVNAAVDEGINCFDTADAYGLGHSEEVLAGALGKRRREVIIATKGGVNWALPAGGGRARTFFDSSPQHIIRALEGSLRRLQLECIPLYQLHWPDPKTPIADTLAALIRAREAGKIRHLGVSNFSLAQIKEVRQFANVSTVQISYNLLNHRAASQTVEQCPQLGAGVIAYGVLAQGFLTGKYNEASVFGADDRRSRLTHFQREARLAGLERLEIVKELARFYRKSPAQVATRWVLDHPSITCAAIGIKTIAQVRENVRSSGWRLSDEHFRQLSSLESSFAPAPRGN